MRINTSDSNSNYDDICYLIDVKSVKDDIGRTVESRSKRMVWCKIHGIGQKEFHGAAQNGFKAECSIEMWNDEYGGEKLVAIDGCTYCIYRSTVNDGIAFLYVEGRKGV